MGLKGYQLNESLPPSSISSRTLLPNFESDQNFGCMSSDFWFSIQHWAFASDLDAWLKFELCGPIYQKVKINWSSGRSLTSLCNHKYCEEKRARSLSKATKMRKRFKTRLKFKHSGQMSKKEFQVMQEVSQTAEGGMEGRTLPI